MRGDLLDFDEVAEVEEVCGGGKGDRGTGEGV